jgi:lipoprotein NlpI
VYGTVPLSEALSKARAAQLRVLELMPDSPEAHVGLGATMLLTRDFAACEREVNRALEIKPDSSEAHRQNGLRLAYLGRLDQALAEFKRAIDLDPTATTARVNYAWCLFFSGRDAESDAELKAVQQIDPSVWFAEFQLFNNSRRKGDYAAAAEHLAHTQELRDEPEAAKFIRDSFRSVGWNGMMRAALGRPDQAKIWEYYLATFAAESGEKDNAFALLNRSADKYDQFVLFAKIDPAMEPLRGDPRYVELLMKLGLQ